MSTPPKNRNGDGSTAGAAPQWESTKRVALHTATIALLTIAIYCPSFRNGYIWDDGDYVYANRSVQGTSTIFDIWFTHKNPQYYPVTFTSFWLEHKIWGLHPAGYHVVNCLLHAANAILLYFLMRRLYEPLAFAVALVFAVHPIQVETVAWISERKNALAVFFFLWACHFAEKHRTERRLQDYLYSLLMFVLSLLSKTITVSFVFVPFVLKWWRRQRIDRWDFVRILPFCAVGMAAGLHTVYLELHHVGAKGPDWELSYAERAVLPGQIVLFYVYKIFVPFHFVFSYPRWPLDPFRATQWIPTALVIALFGCLIRYRNRVGRGAAATFGFFVLSLFPALGIFSVYPMRYSYVADHFAYLSTIPLLMFMGGAYAFLLESLGQSRLRLSDRAVQGIARFLLIVGSAVMSVEAVQHVRDFHDAETLWLHVIRANPRSTLAYNNLGLIYQERGQVDLAAECFRNGLQVDPGDAEIRNNLGILLVDRGRLDEALEHFQAALQAKPNDPDTCNNIATAHAMKGQEDRAVEYYERALKLAPDHSQALSNLGRICRNRGDIDRAIQYFEQAIQSDADFLEARLELGALYSDLHRVELAIRAFAAAAALGGSDPRPPNNLAMMYLRQGRVDAAVAGFEEALRRNPDLVSAHYELGLICLQRNQLTEAYRHFAKVKESGQMLDADVERFLQGYRNSK